MSETQSATDRLCAGPTPVEPAAFLVPFANPQTCELPRDHRPTPMPRPPSTAHCTGPSMTPPASSSHICSAASPKAAPIARATSTSASCSTGPRIAARAPGSKRGCGSSRTSGRSRAATMSMSSSSTTHLHTSRGELSRAAGASSAPNRSRITPSSGPRCSAPPTSSAFCAGRAR